MQAGTFCFGKIAKTDQRWSLGRDVSRIYWKIWIRIQIERDGVESDSIAKTRQNWLTDWRGLRESKRSAEFEKNDNFDKKWKRIYDVFNVVRSENETPI